MTTTLLSIKKQTSPQKQKSMDNVFGSLLLVMGWQNKTSHHAHNHKQLKQVPVSSAYAIQTGSKT